MQQEEPIRDGGCFREVMGGQQNGGLLQRQGADRRPEMRGRAASRLRVGSSSKSTLGRLTSARAMPIAGTYRWKLMTSVSAFLQDRYRGEPLRFSACARPAELRRGRRRIPGSRGPREMGRTNARRRPRFRLPSHFAGVARGSKPPTRTDRHRGAACRDQLEGRLFCRAVWTEQHQHLGAGCGEGNIFKRDRFAALLPSQQLNGRACEKSYRRIRDDAIRKAVASTRTQ